MEVPIKLDILTKTPNLMCILSVVENVDYYCLTHT